LGTLKQWETMNSPRKTMKKHEYALSGNFGPEAAEDKSRAFGQIQGDMLVYAKFLQNQVLKVGHFKANEHERNIN